MIRSFVEKKIQRLDFLGLVCVFMGIESASENRERERKRTRARYKVKGPKDAN